MLLRDHRIHEKEDYPAAFNQLINIRLKLQILISIGPFILLNKLKLNINDSQETECQDAARTR